MEDYKLKKNNGYSYLYHKGIKVCGTNPTGKMWGATKHLQQLKKMLKEVYQNGTL